MANEVKCCACGKAVRQTQRFQLRFVRAFGTRERILRDKNGVRAERYGDLRRFALLEFCQPCLLVACDGMGPGLRSVAKRFQWAAERARLAEEAP